MVQEMFLIWSSGGPFVQRSGTICASLVEGIKRKFCGIILNLDQWFRKRCHLKDFLPGDLESLLFGVAEPFVQFLMRAS